MVSHSTLVCMDCQILFIRTWVPRKILHSQTLLLSSIDTGPFFYLVIIWMHGSVSFPRFDANKLLIFVSSYFCRMVRVSSERAAETGHHRPSLPGDPDLSSVVFLSAQPLQLFKIWSQFIQMMIHSHLMRKINGFKNTNMMYVCKTHG